MFSEFFVRPTYVLEVIVLRQNCMRLASFVENPLVRFLSSRTTPFNYTRFLPHTTGFINSNNAIRELRRYFFERRSHEPWCPTFPIFIAVTSLWLYLFMRKGTALLSETLTTVVSIISQVYIFVIVVKCGYKTITSRMARRATIRWMAASRMRSRDLETFRDRDLSLA